MFGDLGTKKSKRANHIPTRARGHGEVSKTLWLAFDKLPPGPPPRTCWRPSVGTELLWGTALCSSSLELEMGAAFSGCVAFSSFPATVGLLEGGF